MILSLLMDSCLTHLVLQMIHSAGLHGSQLATPFLEASCLGFLVINHLFYHSADQTLTVCYLQRLLHTANGKRKAFNQLNAGTLQPFTYIYAFIYLFSFPVEVLCHNLPMK